MASPRCPPLSALVWSQVDECRALSRDIAAIHVRFAPRSRQTRRSSSLAARVLFLSGRRGSKPQHSAWEARGASGTPDPARCGQTQPRADSSCARRAERAAEPVHKHGQSGQERAERPRLPVDAVCARIPGRDRGLSTPDPVPAVAAVRIAADAPRTARGRLELADAVAGSGRTRSVRTAHANSGSVRWTATATPSTAPGGGGHVACPQGRWRFGDRQQSPEHDGLTSLPGLGWTRSAEPRHRLGRGAGAYCGLVASFGEQRVGSRGGRKREFRLRQRRGAQLVRR